VGKVGEEKEEELERVEKGRRGEERRGEERRGEGKPMSWMSSTGEEGGLQDLRRKTLTMPAQGAVDGPMKTDHPCLIGPVKVRVQTRKTGRQRGESTGYLQAPMRHE